MKRSGALVPAVEILTRHLEHVLPIALMAFVSGPAAALTAVLLFFLLR